MTDDAIHALVGTEAALVAELARAVEAGLVAQIDARARQLLADAEALEAARAMELEALQVRLNALSLALHQQAEALAVAERFANGQATAQELDAAESAAWSAARSAAESAAWSAAWSAARSAQADEFRKVVKNPFL
jgi:hypothetical protein